MSRPEHTAPPEIFYNEKEAQKYSVSSRMNQIQMVISERALELLSLPTTAGPQLLLDIGCGTGLSGEAIERAGHAWMGIDISQHMLNMSVKRFERDAEASEENAMEEEDDDDEEEDDSENEEKKEKGAPIADVACRDMGSGLGFRGGVFDGAISISAVQWLCYANHKHHVPKLRLRAFFQSLYSCLKRGARAVLQFYPETPQQMELITGEALAVGFTGGVVVDYPNSAKAKKYYLVLFAGRASSSSSSKEKKRANSSGMSVAASAMTAATAVSKYTMPPLPKGLDGDEPDEYGDDNDDDGGQRGKSIPYESRTREKKRGRKRVRDREDRPSVKSKEWIQHKRQRQAKQGKETKRESKYTGRRRKGGF